MALKGTLRDFSLADIFQLIGIQKKTGVLTLKNPEESATVTFVDGHVVGADSTLRRLEDRLGSVLVKSGRLSDAQLQEALKIQHSTLKRLGTVLVEKGLIDAAGLSQALQAQICQMVYRLFRWSSGEYQFVQEAKVEYERDLVSPMSAESVLMEGARILDEWPMIEKGLRSFGAVYRHANVEIARKGTAAEGPMEPAGAVTLSDEERLIHGLVDGRRTVQEIVDAATISEFDTCRTLFELLSRHLLEEVRRPVPKGVPAPAPRPSALSPVLVGLGYLLLVVLAGGALLYRALPWAGQAGRGRDVLTWLTPLVSPRQERAIEVAVARSRVQRIRGALEVYYLLNRGYPTDLRYLVSDGLARPETLSLPSGAPILYVSDGVTYKLGQASGQDE